jgi:hypothetical protein
VTAWAAYRITLRLLAPLHIGWRKLGNLQQTRPYVTGRSLWGGLTARLTRDAGSECYETVGGEVDLTLAFTYFYPSTHPDQVALWPWGERRDEFEWLFLDSYAGAALQDGHSAEEGSLHETEFIAPHARDGLPVFLFGYIFESQRCALDWRSALGSLQLGGERGYGWGRMRLEGEPVRNQRCFGLHLDDNAERPTLTVPRDKPFLAHAIACGMECKGAIEPLLGREFDAARGGFGGKHSSPDVCWAPGSRLTRTAKFRIGPRGVWQLADRVVGPETHG